MNPSHRRSWTLLSVLALLLMGLFSSAALVNSPATEAQSLLCEAEKSIQVGETDTDSDGLTDQEETQGTLLPLNAGGASWTPTEPNNKDTDGDGICDGDEILGYQITLVNPTGQEITLTHYSDPTMIDSDEDGSSDGDERDAGTNPLKPDDVPVAPTPTPEPTAGPPTRTPTPTPTPDTPIRFSDETFPDQGYTVGTPIPALTLPVATGGDGPLKYEVDDLPPELTFDPAARSISGAATTGGRFPVVYTVTDSDAASPESDRLNFNIDVKFLPPDNVRVNNDGLIEWDLTPGAYSYEAQYRGPDGEWTEAKTEGQLNAVIPSPGADADYQVRVRTKHTDPKLNSDWSSPISWKTPAAAPTVLTPEPSSQSSVPTDTDGDGISDADEKEGWSIDVTFMDASETKMWVYSDPTKPDTDDDGRGDYWEKQNKTDPTRADTDGDGLTDNKEEEQGPNPPTTQYTPTSQYTNPTMADSDRDGLSDAMEIKLKTNPLKHDTDGDKLPDGEEVLGVIRGDFTMYSNPLLEDSDGDGIDDYTEINGWPMMINGVDETAFSNPLSKDSDGDGIDDYTEINGWTMTINGLEETVFGNPSSTDTDGDGLKDGLERLGVPVAIAGKPLTVLTNPSSKDTDGDGKDDNSEISGWSISEQAGAPSFKTDPSHYDSDRDGLPDYVVPAGTGQTPTGTEQDPNPVEPDRGPFESVLGVLGAVLVSGQNPYSLVAVLVAAAGGMGWMWLRATRSVTGDAARQELNGLQREYKDLQNQTDNEISHLKEDVSSKDQEVSQLQTNLQRYQASVRLREEDLNTAVQDLVRAADELGERRWSVIIEALTGVGRQGTAQGDATRDSAAVSRHVNDLKRQVSEQRGRARELISTLRAVGLDTSGIQGAVENAPATALPSLIDSLEAFVQQHNMDPQAKERLLLDIQRAEAHCSRDITDSVGRRVPLQFLARAREMLEQATTQVQLNAAVTIGDRIVDDIYRLYLPRATR